MTDQPALFPAPARRPPTWIHTATRAYVYFDIRDAADIQDGRTTRRRVMRPTHLEILTTGTTVDVVWVHGPSVRRNGSLGAVQTRTYRRTDPDPRQPDPPWLTDLLHEHGLTFRCTGRRDPDEEGPPSDHAARRRHHTLRRH